MSIRGRGPHTVILQPRKIERYQGAVDYVDDGPPVKIERCSVQSVREWATAEEIFTHGLSLLSMRRVFTRTWPADANGLVYFNGGIFETVGDPQHMDGSRRTAHWVTTIKWLGDGPPPHVPDINEEQEGE
ncbi:hypothetical protein ACFWHR_07680 [Leucobacter sp. NPDC058333]|uniref:hypothetical protein n=1 Tax=Leucobacter sp. NPDC058333 TaxID=3346450 RepID=UPI003650FF4D